jgi:hypothetical protein
VHVCSLASSVCAAQCLDGIAKRIPFHENVREHAIVYWLRHYAPKVAGPRPDEVIEFYEFPYLHGLLRGQLKLYFYFLQRKE